jgi:hypothetical protein
VGRIAAGHPGLPELARLDADPTHRASRDPWTSARSPQRRARCPPSDRQPVRPSVPSRSSIDPCAVDPMSGWHRHRRRSGPLTLGRTHEEWGLSACQNWGRLPGEPWGLFMATDRRLAGGISVPRVTQVEPIINASTPADTALDLTHDLAPTPAARRVARGPTSAYWSGSMLTQWRSKRKGRHRIQSARGSEPRRDDESPLITCYGVPADPSPEAQPAFATGNASIGALSSATRRR